MWATTLSLLTAGVLLNSSTVSGAGTVVSVCVRGGNTLVKNWVYKTLLIVHRLQEYCRTIKLHVSSSLAICTLTAVDLVEGKSWSVLTGA